MSGSLWEWVADWYDEDYYEESPRVNPRGPGAGTLKAMRGGSWYDANVEAWTSTTIRHQNPPTDRYEDVGFRCAADSGPKGRDRPPTGVTRVPVPAGNAIEIDGILGDEEWSDAGVFRMTGGRRLWLKHDGSRLYLGVRGHELGWVHVGTRKADRVRIWHASAALGTFEHFRVGTDWDPERFSGWAVRDTTLLPEAAAEREAHLEEHGWMASTAWMGSPTDREFVIRLDALGGCDPTIAVLHATDLNTPEYSHWPAALSDGLLDARLLSGRSATALQFDFGTSSHLVLVSPEGREAIEQDPIRCGDASVGLVRDTSS